MKNTIYVILLITFANFVYAGGNHKHGHGHSHKHDEKTILVGKSKVIAEKEIIRLVSSGKLDKSWKTAKYDKSIKKKFGKNTEWVVTFNNEKGVKGKTLYVFLKISGEFIAANFSGN